MADGPVNFPVLEPNLQVSFYYKLQGIRRLHLQEALSAAVSQVPVSQIDSELTARVGEDDLARVASFGLRGELFFPVPCLLLHRPSLLGYYRLLLGFSQKEFYNKGPFGRFRRLEERGELPVKVLAQVEPLCASLIASSQKLVHAIDDLSIHGIHQLQLLTLGSQLRGEENTRIGQQATKEVYDLLRDLLANYVVEATRRTLVVENDSGRAIILEFASDPDVRVTEKLTEEVRPIVSMEIKGGEDASNVHNRLGEAEKSHQKARAQGFFQFWTIARVDVEVETVRRESPTTTHFFNLARILDRETSDHSRFRDLLCSVVGVRGRV